MSDNLDSYRRKRDFSATPEPSGGDRADDDAAPRFVVQEHHARALHWDLRLEHDGALASWAVPKGIPPDPKRNHLAVRTEDHPLEYLDFHGEIPAGEYGAGTMKIWDRGTYELHKWRDDEVMVTFHGERASRAATCCSAPTASNWMIHRMDPPQDPDREPMPEKIEPMLARTGAAARATTRTGRTRSSGTACARSATPRAAACGWQRAAGATSRPAIPSCASSGERWRAARRCSTARSSPSTPTAARASSSCRAACTSTSEHAVRRLSQSDPVAYIMFDLLWLDGHSLMDLPYAERRERLLELGLQGRPGRRPRTTSATARRCSRPRAPRGSRASSPSASTARTRRGAARRGWVKVKNVRRDRRGVGGWLPGEGGRAGQLGALRRSASTRTARCATRAASAPGFDEARARPARRPARGAGARHAARSRAASRRARRASSSRAGGARRATGSGPRRGTLRHPRYKGLRDDIDAGEDVRAYPDVSARRGASSLARAGTTCQNRKLAGTDVFPIGLGAMPHVALRAGPPEERSIRTIHAALDAGVNLIDTADAYCVDETDVGHNERLIAKALRGRRDGVIVATKGGHTRPGGAWELDGRPEHIRPRARRR